MRRLSRDIQITLVIVLAGLGGAFVSGVLLVDHAGGWPQESSDAGLLAAMCNSQLLPGGTCSDVVATRWGSFDFYIGHRRVYVPLSLVGLAH